LDFWPSPRFRSGGRVILQSMVSTAELHTDSQIGRFDSLSKNGPRRTDGLGDHLI
jgi:hypothetical protein